MLLSICVCLVTLITPGGSVGSALSKPTTEGNPLLELHLVGIRRQCWQGRSMYQPLHERLPLLECGVIQVHDYQTDYFPRCIDYVCPEPFKEWLDSPFSPK